MSIPRYSCSASALTTSPSSSSARRTARSDFPVAVAPTTATMGAGCMLTLYGEEYGVGRSGPSGSEYFLRPPRFDVTAVHGSPHPAVGAGDLPPIRLERVEESLTRLGYAYAQDAEQPEVLRARFDDYRFHVLLAGAHRSVLQIRGRWSHSVDISRKVEML